jgi:hypothetical protein
LEQKLKSEEQSLTQANSEKSAFEKEMKKIQKNFDNEIKKVASITNQQ